MSMMKPPRTLQPGLECIGSSTPVPGIGLLPVNVYLLKGAEPIVIDTGMFADGPRFLETLGSTLDLEDLRWIWLTHPDSDHIGSLQTLLAAAPNAELLTSFVSVGFLSLRDELPMQRVRVVNPGETLTLPDRTLTAVRPPTYDSPATLGVVDSKTRAFFCADSFGAVLSEVDDDLSGLGAPALRASMHLWSSIDSPWVENLSQTRWDQALERLRALDLDWLLSAHLPPGKGRTDELLGIYRDLPQIRPFGPQ